MKANISKIHNFTKEEEIMLLNSLDWLIDTDHIDGVSFQRMQETISLAINVREKIRNHETLYNAEDMRIIACALYNAQVIVSECDPNPHDNESEIGKEEALDILHNLVSFFESRFKAAGLMDENAIPLGTSNPNLN